MNTKKRKNTSILSVWLSSGQISATTSFTPFASGASPPSGMFEGQKKVKNVNLLPKVHHFLDLHRNCKDTHCAQQNLHMCRHQMRTCFERKN